MTVQDAQYILDLLGPMLEDTGRWCCAVQGGRLAVVILDEPVNVTRSDFLTALALRDELGSGLLIVL